jgi:hypothetical protein
VSPRVKDLLWVPINLLQALWMVGFTGFCFVPGMLTVLVTGNPSRDVSTCRRRARRLWR